MDELAQLDRSQDSDDESEWEREPTVSAPVDAAAEGIEAERAEDVDIVDEGNDDGAIVLGVFGTEADAIEPQSQ